LQKKIRRKNDKETNKRKETNSAAYDLLDKDYNFVKREAED